MKVGKVISLVLGLIVFAGVVAIQAQAQVSQKRTSVTFDQPVAVPGMVLPAGKYTFTALDLTGFQHVVQIWNGDKSKLITTVLAISNYRLKRAGETIIEFGERPAGEPQALKAWFYPSYNHGFEFVYPKKEAILLAQASNEVVPAEAVEPTPSTLETLPLVAVTPQGKEEPIAEAFPEKTAEAPLVAKELPKTASPLPLIALLGALSLAVGFGVRQFGSKKV
jgi:hypothetical protein